MGEHEDKLDKGDKLDNGIYNFGIDCDVDGVNDVVVERGVDGR